ncbi:MAG: hypothetical protein JXA33_07140, partial [Anaerolineae bacterium]|nr:hypothetical protein [Anaerolineae bacterium]
MNIQIKGANEHNLKNIDVDIGDGLTVVTGVSGSGKTSLVFDTLYHEARRRFLEIFSLGERLAPADVRDITGMGPAIAVGQNLLNRNPDSTLATAAGLHPFLRLLYARFGERHCARCGTSISVLTEDDIVERIRLQTEDVPVILFAPLLQEVKGSHRTLLSLLAAEFGAEKIWIDAQNLPGFLKPAGFLDPTQPHTVAVELMHFETSTPARDIREAVQKAWALGANAVQVESQESKIEIFSRAPVCTVCGAWFGELSPVYFNSACPHCNGEGCEQCAHTGLHPEASATTWHNLHLPDLLAQSVDEVRALFAQVNFPATAARLQEEITRRLESLHRVGLGYIALNRSSPTLSRGESQRVRLALSLTSRLEDMLHVLDEPTIGLHPADVARLLPAFRDLAGPVVYVEHDRIAATHADHAIDIGPGAGGKGGHIIFTGTPAELWEAGTVTGRYFSLRERVVLPEHRPPPIDFLTVRGANLRTLQAIDVPIPLGRLTVITGVSGSGKSTFVEDVLAASLAGKTPVGCQDIEGAVSGGKWLKAVIVDQSPIGRNPRSNPATYTNLANIIRDVFADATDLSPSHFSFNRPEGQCPACKGIGAVEVTMRYMPSTWIPCAACNGQRFNDEVLEATVDFSTDGTETPPSKPISSAQERRLSVADFYALPVGDAAPLLLKSPYLSDLSRRAARHILRALRDIGLGYLTLGQPSPTLSGGEAQRVKLAKFLGKRSLAEQVLIMDEPSTGLHPQDVAGLLTVLDRLVRSGATVVVVEHNTDIIRAADWVIDLGPGAGPNGGQLLYAGPPEGLLNTETSVTGEALRSELANRESKIENQLSCTSCPVSTIRIRGARAHNLKNVDVDFPKSALTVVTGVSGSGKSSLVGDVLEAEARRRFLEMLSLYERQGTHEGPEAPVDEVSGLGVAVMVEGGGRGAFGRRNTVGTATEITHHL